MDYAYIDERGHVIEIITDPTSQQTDMTSPKLARRGVAAVEEAPIGFANPIWVFNDSQWKEEEFPIEPDLIEQLVEEVHQKAWEFIYSFADEGGMLQLADWKHSLPEDHEVQPLIAAIELWKNAVMVEYLLGKKPQIQAGNLAIDTSYDFIGSAPVTFTDLFLTVTLQYRPEGWVVPDVSTYTPGTH